MKTDNIVILNREHLDFKRLYWNTDKEKKYNEIKEFIYKFIQTDIMNIL